MCPVKDRSRGTEALPGSRGRWGSAEWCVVSRVGSDSTRLIIIRGNSGTGKSALVPRFELCVPEVWQSLAMAARVQAALAASTPT